MESGLITRYVFLDCSKAFDRVWHRGLLYKLEIIGIRGKLLDWIKSYLTDRKQYVGLNGAKSSTKTLHAGVPQGSILGPLLFLIYVNDIMDAVDVNIRMYADDTCIYASGKNETEIADKLNNALSNINNWANRWLVTFNPNKTESVCFSRKRSNNKPPLLMNNTPIKDVKEHKHLGVVLQSNAKWKTQVESIITKCQKRLNILASLKFKFKRSTLETLYKSFIRPCMEYGNDIWCNCTIEQKRELEGLQLKAARIVTGAIKGTVHENIYNECNWQSTYERRMRKNLVNYYKIYHKKSPQYLTTLLPKRNLEKNNYLLRNRHNLQNIPAQSSQYTNSFFPRLTKIWNTVPDPIKYIGSLTDYKKHLKKDDKYVPKLYHHGGRKFQIHMSRLRMKCSPLNQHLYDMKVIDSATCACGYGNEDINHYFFECPNFRNERQVFNTLDQRVKNVNTILQGNDQLPKNMIRELYGKVEEYINNTGRFIRVN